MLFKSYLHNRSQFVAYNGNNSSKLPITRGVPQGSMLGLLGLLFFLIYINDIVNISDIFTTYFIYR